MRIRDCTLPSPYSGSMPSRFECEERTGAWESACQQGFWFSALDFLWAGPIEPEKRDSELLKAMEILSEEMCLRFLQAARSQGPLPAQTDSNILVLAAKRGFNNLAAEAIENGVIQPQKADAALKIAAKTNNQELVQYLLLHAPCTSEGKAQATEH